MIRGHADDSGLLIDADDFYRAVYEVAQRAERFILFAGWQFNTNMQIICGADATSCELPVKFMDFLEALLVRKPELEIYLLAWDFNPIYMLERELFQKWKFSWKKSDRMHYELDGKHPPGASQHQKLVIIDGTLAYTGGMDVCDHRWDDREHQVDNEYRVNIDGDRYHPYHDVQAYVTGPAARELTELFKCRWEQATGDELELPELEIVHETRATIRIGPAEVRFPQTRACLDDEIEKCGEICELYQETIRAAERMIYIENQYFTATKIYAALAERFRDASRGKLDVAFVLPRNPSAFKEAIALGVRQCMLLTSLTEIAKEHGHRLGFYYSSPTDSIEDATYIHSKILVVDDTYLCVGSANTTNRSMGLDTELDCVWQGAELEEKIREIRVSLLREHAGSDAIDGRFAGMVEMLEQRCDDDQTRLYRLPCDDYGPLEEWFDDDEIPDIAFDPEGPDLLEGLRPLELNSGRGLFARGMGWVGRHVGKGKG